MGSQAQVCACTEWLGWCYPLFRPSHFEYSGLAGCLGGTLCSGIPGHDGWPAKEETGPFLPEGTISSLFGPPLILLRGGIFYCHIAKDEHSLDIPCCWMQTTRGVISVGHLATHSSPFWSGHVGGSIWKLWSGKSFFILRQRNWSLMAFDHPNFLLCISSLNIKWQFSIQAVRIGPVSAAWWTAKGALLLGEKEASPSALFSTGQEEYFHPVLCPAVCAVQGGILMSHASPRLLVTGWLFVLDRFA